MKNLDRIPALVTILLLLMVGSLLIQGCEKPEPPGSEPVFYTMSTLVKGKGSVSPDKLSGIVLGSNVSIKITPDTNYSTYSVKVNRTEIEEIIPLGSEFVFNVNNIKSNTKIEVEFIETNILLISVKSTNDKPWMLIQVGAFFKEEDLFLGYWNLSEVEKTDKYYLMYPSMKVEVYQANGGVRSGKWNLSGNELKIGGEELVLVELTLKKFVYRSNPVWSPANNAYTYALYTYERR